MKNIPGFILLILALSACQKEDSVPVQNQISFKLDGQSIECTPDFYWSGKYNGSGVFAGHFQSIGIEDGEIELHTSHFFQLGDYLIDPSISMVEEEISLWSGGSPVCSTYHGFPDQCPDTGRISIEEITDQYIKGSFECVFNPVCGGATRYITEGKFTIMRE